MEGQQYVKDHGWKYVDTDSLYEAAEKAMQWYNHTGMKVAKCPDMPQIAARWILRYVKPKDV